MPSRRHCAGVDGPRVSGHIFVVTCDKRAPGSQTAGCVEDAISERTDLLRVIGMRKAALDTDGHCAMLWTIL